MSEVLTAFVDELDKIAEADDIGAAMPQDKLPLVTKARLKALIPYALQAGLGTGLGVTGYYGYKLLRAKAPEVADWVVQHKAPVVGGLAAAGALAAMMLHNKTKQYFNDADAREAAKAKK